MDQINQLLRKVLDTEIIFSLFFKEQDANAKQIYFFLFKLLRKSILNPRPLATATTNPNSTTTTPTKSSNLNHTIITHSPGSAYTTHSASSSPGGGGGLPTTSTSIPTAIEAHLGRPPFDEPSITKAVVNFLFVKYGRSGENDLQSMFEACKLFLYCLNMWKFETPAAFVTRYRSLVASTNNSASSSNHHTNNHHHHHNSHQNNHHPQHHHHHNSNNHHSDSHTSSNESAGGGEPSSETEQELLASYNISYHRWMCYNYVPSFCDSLEKHETIVIFGVPFLRLIFGLVKHDLEEKFISERDKIPSEKRQIFCSYLPRYVSFILFFCDYFLNRNNYLAKLMFLNLVETKTNFNRLFLFGI